MRELEWDRNSRKKIVMIHPYHGVIALDGEGVDTVEGLEVAKVRY